MTKENSLLKEQLRKYVSEAQELKRANKVLEAAGREDEGGGGGADEPDGFKSVGDMQAHFEQQILQLADMHCELLELNEKMAERLARRDAEILRLGGTVPDDGAGDGTVVTASGAAAGAVRRAPGDRHGVEAPQPCTLPPIPIGGEPALNVWIPDALQRGQGSDTHVVYRVCISIGADAWSILRRYSNFEGLNAQVKKIFGADKLSSKFPRKGNFKTKGAKFIEARRAALEAYLRDVVGRSVNQKNSPVRKERSRRALCQTLPFLRA